MRTVEGIRPSALVGRIPKPIEPGDLRPRQTIRDLKDCSIRFRLCADGPDGCARCLICEYGKEWVRRQEARRNGKQKQRQR